LVSDGGSPYHRIRSEEVGDEDVETLRLIGFSGWGPVAVDVRFTDLLIGADRIGAPGEDEAAARPFALSKTWLAAALFAGRLISVGVSVWLFAPRRGTGQPAQAEQPDTFGCPACGGRLRARAALAGKRVKCPRCAQAVLVPGAGAETANLAPRPGAESIRREGND